MEPFTSFSNKWTVLLALTSNPSAEDFEFHGGTPLFEDVCPIPNFRRGRPPDVRGGRHAARALGRVRKLVPEAFLLVPGWGPKAAPWKTYAPMG